MKEFVIQMQKQFDKMCQTGKLFKSSVTGKEVWDLYLKSFKEDPKFRDPESSVHNCNICNSFVRRYGNIVAIDENNNIISIFDFEVDKDNEYYPVVIALSNKLKTSNISDVFFETYDELNSMNYEKCSKTSSIFRLGLEKNSKRYTKEEAEKFGVVKANEIRNFYHMFLTIPVLFIDKSGKSVESIMSDYRSSKEVFQRAMETISLDTLMLVKDLINQGSLLDGTTHLFKIEQIIPLKKQFDDIPKHQQENWCWLNSYKLPFAKFRNELIGVLCSELSEGMELNLACTNWNKRVDPVNYMKASAPITKKQIEEAKKFVQENGYEESFNRRFATIEDIKASEILHLNTDTKIKTVSIFDGVKSTSTQHKRNEFDKVEEVTIDKFMKDILPECTGVEVFLTNSQEGNMVSLTTANNPDSKPIFKWNNNYSWTFNGNLAGKSQIKEAVKSFGGKVDGVLRFSIMWSGNDQDNSDLDAHCTEPLHHIYFGSKLSRSGGNLDIDIRRPLYECRGKEAVENITFPKVSTMKDGTYLFFVHQYMADNSKGFKAEIEFNGELYSYSYDKAVSGDVQIAEITLKNGIFTIVHKLPAIDGIGVTKEIYGLETNQFHKVNLVCLSPNHWEPNNVGNKHYFFMLQNCKSPISIRSFHNENLLPELATHRKVLEVLGNSSMIESTNKQLSGLGFNSTVQDEVILKLSGTHKRVIKVKFQGVSKNKLKELQTI